METLNQALETVSRTVYDNQRRQAETVHRLLNAVWVANQSIENGIRDVQQALATDWPTIGPQPLDRVLDELEAPLLPVPVALDAPVAPDAPEPDPETADRIARIAASFEDAMGRVR